MKANELDERARKQHGLVTRIQALEAGMTPSAIGRRLKSGAWDLIQPNVYRLASSARSECQRVLAHCLSLGPHAYASHGTAAWLWKLDGFKAQRSVDISSTRGRRSTAAGLLLHTRRDALGEGFTWRFGVPTTLLARTLLDLAPLLSPQRLEGVLDSAGRGNPAFFTELDEFLNTLKAKGRTQIGTLAHLVMIRRGTVATGSSFETQVLQRVRGAGLQVPVLQFQILDEEGVLPIAYADFAWPGLKMLLMADGISFHKTRRRFEDDAALRARLTALGWRYVVVTPHQLDDATWLTAMRKLVPRAQLALLAEAEPAQRAYFLPEAAPTVRHLRAPGPPNEQLPLLAESEPAQRAHSRPEALRGETQPLHQCSTDSRSRWSGD